MPNLSIIAAAGMHNEIGFHHHLLCHLPADLTFFKTITWEHDIVVGHRTWDSLPTRPLPHRKNIVLSKNLALSLPGATVVHSVEELFHVIDNEKETFVIGGESIYRLLFEKTTTIYLTRIMGKFLADAFFPEIDEKKWQLESDTFRPKDEENPYDLHFQKWIRKA
ncbi:MAG: dihydrofolate reductase [Bacteroidales bacterium]|nr:dihydrofolate reductase [Bacteroidales bacterium]